MTVIEQEGYESVSSDYDTRFETLLYPREISLRLDRVESQNVYHSQNSMI